MSVSRFGPLIDNDDVEQAVQDTISYWIDAYLAAKERAKGLSVPTIQRPLSYPATYDDENWPEGQTPAVSVVCPGTVGSPEFTGASVSAWFEVSVYAQVADETEALARKGAAMYASALAALLSQKGALAGGSGSPFAVTTRLMDWKLALPDAENRTLAVGVVTVHTYVGSIFDTLGGPVVLPGAPESDPGPWPTIETVDVTVDVKPPTM